MFVLNLALSNCALSREPMSEEFEKKIKKYGSMSGVRKVAGVAEESIVAKEDVNDVAIPSSPRDPTEEASLDATEALTSVQPPSLVLPLASSAPNEGVASIDVVASTEPDDEVTPVHPFDADDTFDDAFMGDGDDDGDKPTTSAASVDDAFMGDDADDGDEPTSSAANVDIAFMVDSADDGDEPTISAAKVDGAFMGDDVDDGDEPAISAANVDDAFKGMVLTTVTSQQFPLRTLTPSWMRRMAW